MRRVRIRGGAWEFESLRDYAIGDDIRTIDWKATARHSRLIVRNHQAERNQTLIILMDSGRLMNAEVEGVGKIESAMTAALILAKVALHRGDRVGLCTFSNRVHNWVAPRARMGQFQLIADSLFDLQADYTESDHGRALRLVAKNHRKRSLLVVLTDFVDAVTAAEMTAHLGLASAGISSCSSRLETPFSPIPPQVGRERSGRDSGKPARSSYCTTAARFSRPSAVTAPMIIDAPPAKITPELINEYVDIVLKGLL